MNYPIVEWVRQNNVMNTDGIYDQLPSIDTDSSGNVYVMYVTTGTASGQMKTGNDDIVVFKMNSSGAVEWVRQNNTMNTGGVEQFRSLTTDSNGNVYVVYFTTGTASGQGPQQGEDIVVFKMNSSGTVQWIRQNNAMNTGASDSYPSLATDSNGNVYVAYYTTGTASGQINTGQRDIVVFKINSSGTVEWVRQNNVMNTGANDEFPSLATDSSGNVYVAYFTKGTASGQGPLQGNNDIVVFKMNPSGTVEWVRQNNTMNTGSDDLYPSINTDTNGNVYVAYNTTGTASGQGPRQGQDIVVFKMNSSGTVQWVRQNNVMNTGSGDRYPSIDTDTNGNVYVAYETQGAASGQGPLQGSYDIVVFKITTSGTVEWVRQNNKMNTGGNDEVPSLATDSNGNVYVAYYTTGTASGQGPLLGVYDIVVFKLRQYPDFPPPLPSPGSTTLQDYLATLPSNLTPLQVTELKNFIIDNAEDFNGYPICDLSGSNVAIFTLEGADVSGVTSILTLLPSSTPIDITPVIPSLINGDSGLYLFGNSGEVFDIQINGKIYEFVLTVTGVEYEGTEYFIGDTIRFGSYRFAITYRGSVGGNFYQVSFPAYVGSSYLTLGTTLLFTEEAVTTLQQNQAVPENPLVSWLPENGLPAGVLLRDLKKTVTVTQNKLYTYKFRLVQQINGPSTEGVGGSLSDLEPYQCGYICTWAASGIPYNP